MINKLDFIIQLNSNSLRMKKKEIWSQSFGLWGVHGVQNPWPVQQTQFTNINITLTAWHDMLHAAAEMRRTRKVINNIWSRLSRTHFDDLNWESYMMHHLCVQEIRKPMIASIPSGLRRIATSSWHVAIYCSWQKARTFLCST